MPVKPFFDTNVIVYAFTSDDARGEKAYALMEAGGVISVQVLSELVSVWRHKQRRDWVEIQEGLGVVKSLLDPPTPLTAEVHNAAVAIARDYGFSIYDGLIVAAALQAGCTTLYSEDLQRQQMVEGLTVRNPFADPEIP